MKRLFIGIIFVLIVLAASSCYRTSYKFSIDQGKTFTNSYWNNYFIYGLAPVKERYNPEDLCGDNQISRLSTKVDGANFLASILSLGLTTSNTITVQCVRDKSIQAKEVEGKNSSAKANSAPSVAKENKTK